MRGIYIHEKPEWPRFTWDTAALTAPLAEARHLQGRLRGRLESLGIDLAQQTELTNVSLDVVKTSAIEGEKLRDDQVRSSVARQLGMPLGGLLPAPPLRHVDGIVEVQLDAVRNAISPVTDTRLFAWHAALFPTGYSGLKLIVTGAYRDDRDGPMQVVSGPLGRERVHYEAVPAQLIQREMHEFLPWLEASQVELDLVLKAGVAHLWFITIHPFADGNGRMARALSDLLLSRSEGGVQKFYSLSAEIHAQRSAYYALLEKTQKSNLDITEWLLWFVACLHEALKSSESSLAASLSRVQFWNRHAEIPFNARQRLVLGRLLGDFEGVLTTQKWAKLAKCSHDTALRDIEALIDYRILQKAKAGSRSTHYEFSALG